MMRYLGALLFFISLVGARLDAQSANKPDAVIVSIDHPKDSLGETVYEHLGKRELNQPIVTGVLTQPTMLKMPKAKYTKALRAEKFSGKATITFIVSEAGNAIDIKADPTDNPEAAKSAIEAAQKYRFKPALLDGRPVAVTLKLVCDFEYYP